MTDTTQRFPRPRGDGPAASDCLDSPVLVPPPARGWTSRVQTSTSRPVGSPARAGMDPLETLASIHLIWFPRPRGDGPQALGRLPRGGKVPPPARGWTRLNRRRRGGLHGSPARAGMDPGRRQPAAGARRFPRPRGDGPGQRVTRTGRKPVPPPARGWTRRLPSGPKGHQGSPARAGMDPFKPTELPIMHRFPRPRGDGPVELQLHIRPVQVPPPARGWTRWRGAEPGLVLGSPARAGMDPADGQARITPEGFPRPRGDGPRWIAAPLRSSPVPPPARGWTLDPTRCRQSRLGSPARAGMDPQNVPRGARSSWFPRPRGDGPS